MPREADLRALPEQVDPACHTECCPDGRCGLECLCRPRFFAGQLLTDQDLRRLDSYIVGKNRLHNRYLHGTGVVCGLEVVCNPCDDTVTVRPGYALGPCGEDIVVCNDARVDVADLIRDCRREKLRPDCRPYGDRADEDCEAAEQKWILAICYDESPSRGVHPLREDPKKPCGHGCASGHGGDACGCSNGNGNGNGHAKRPPSQCEPTVICEGYRFKLYKEKPRPKREPRTDRLEGLLSSSELGRRVSACLLKLVARVRELPEERDRESLARFCCELKEDLRDVIETGNVHDCLLGARLSDVVCPNPSDEQFAAKISQALTALMAIAVELFRSCVCSALLPPCPTSSTEDCVPLATLTVRSGDLRVLSICNWSSRRFAVTLPTLGYWLGWLPVFDALRAAVARLCCAPRRTPEFTVTNSLRAKANIRSTVGPSDAAPPPVETATTERVASQKGSAFSRIGAHYARSASPLSGLDATVLAALGLKDEDDGDLATELELANPMTALGLTRLAAPAAASFLPEELVTLLGGLVGRKAERPEPVEPEPDRPSPRTDERLADLEKQLDSLRRTVDAQRRTINQLKRVDPNR